MTALAAFFALDDRPSAAVAEPCRRILAAQAMYGKIDSHWRGNAIAIGRRLYPLLPEDRFDRGIVVGRESGLVLAADIRLDNREELSRNLGLLEMSRTSDADIALAAFERWDENAVARLIGDFALILWNPRAQSLLLARDFLGNRPLHFHRGRDFLAVASMPKGLHALPDVPKAVDTERMLDLLALIPPVGTETHYEAIERVEPAHCMRFTRGGVDSRRYWTAPTRALILPRAEDYAGAMRGQLDEAVARRLRSIGPIGSHLSGGLDSGAVATSAAIQLDHQGTRLMAFTAVPRPDFEGSAPDGRIADEGQLAASTAAIYTNIDHVRVPAGARSPIDLARRYALLCDRPAVSLCQRAWGDSLNDAAKAHGISTMLTGQGGNVTLSFEPKYLLADMIRKGRLVHWARESASLVRGGITPAKLAAMTFAPFLPGQSVQWIRRLSGRSMDLSDYSMVSSDAKVRDRLVSRAAERGLDFGYAPRRNAAYREWVLRRIDYGNYAKGSLAGWGIDHRDPTTDRRVVEFCWSVPDERYLRAGKFRALGRDAFGDRLPRAIRDVRYRGHQGADWYMSLVQHRAEMVEEIARLSDVADVDSILDLKRMTDVTGRIRNQDWSKHAAIYQYRYGLMRGLAAATFVRLTNGSNR